MRSIIVVAITAVTLTGCVPADNAADPNLTTSGSGGSSTAKAKAKAKTTRSITYRIGGPR